MVKLQFFFDLQFSFPLFKQSKHFRCNLCLTSCEQKNTLIIKSTKLNPNQMFLLALPTTTIRRSEAAMDAKLKIFLIARGSFISETLQHFSHLPQYGEEECVTNLKLPRAGYLFDSKPTGEQVSRVHLPNVSQYQSVRLRLIQANLRNLKK